MHGYDFVKFNFHQIITFNELLSEDLLLKCVFHSEIVVKCPILELAMRETVKWNLPGMFLAEHAIEGRVLQARLY